MAEGWGGGSPPPAACPQAVPCRQGVAGGLLWGQGGTDPAHPSGGLGLLLPQHIVLLAPGVQGLLHLLFFFCVCVSRAFACGSALLFIAGWCLWVVFSLPLFSCLCLCRHRGRIAVISYHGEYYSRRSTSPPCHPQPLVLSRLGKASSQPGGSRLCDTDPGTPLLPQPSSHRPEPCRVPVSGQDPPGDRRVPSPLPLPRRDPAEGTGTRTGTADVAAAIFEQIAHRSTRGRCTEGGLRSGCLQLLLQRGKREARG